MQSYINILAEFNIGPCTLLDTLLFSCIRILRLIVIT